MVRLDGFILPLEHWKLKAPRLSVRLHKSLYDFSLVFNAKSFQTKFHCVLGINVFNKLDM